MDRCRREPNGLKRRDFTRRKLDFYHGDNISIVIDRGISRYAARRDAACRFSVRPGLYLQPANRMRVVSKLIERQLTRLDSLTHDEMTPRCDQDTK